MARKLPDLIFAAIAAHREVHEEFRTEASFLWPKRRQSKAAAEYDAARKTYEAATEKLVVTKIQTLAGAQAFATYLANLQCCGRSDIAPGVYAVETWDLSAGMDRIAECLARLSTEKAERPRSKAVPVTVSEMARAA